MKMKKWVLCKVLKKINDYAFVIDFSGSMGISKTFNVAYLYEYFSYIKLNSRTGPTQMRETDVEQSSQEFMN